MKKVVAAPKMDSVHSDPQNPLDETFDAFVQTLLQEWHVPGMSIAVVDGDQTFAKVGRQVVSQVYTSNESRDMALQLFRANQSRPKHFSILPAQQSHLRQQLYHYSSTMMQRHVLRQVNPVQLLRTSRSPGKLAWPP